MYNIIQPLLEKNFIYDSYANRIGKGTLKAIQRFDYFKRKISKNNTKSCYILKADIKHYFENVNHNILINILKSKIVDKRIIALIKTILVNYSNDKGMPLGNLTSQFFANVYLNELDQFIKHEIKAKYYIRYVDDFVIFNNSKDKLLLIKIQISLFLKKLKLELHPDKSKIIPLSQGIPFLGTKIFFYHKIIIKKNKNKFKRKYLQFTKTFTNYDQIYDFLEGWLAHIKNFNTHNQRINLLNDFQENYSQEISSKEVNRILKAQRKV